MTSQNLSQILKGEAVERGLCAEWTAGWADNSGQQALIDKYKAGIDFVLRQGEWPANDFIRANFDARLLYDNLIFVDEHIDLTAARSGVYVLNGACTGIIRFAPWSAATVYVRHSSKIEVVAGDFAKVFVRLYDEAEAKGFQLDGAVVKIRENRNLQKKKKNQKE